jgi:hypothetical protein
MLNIKNLKYLTDSKGKRIGVVIPIKEYERIIKSLEDFNNSREITEK